MNIPQIRIQSTPAKIEMSTIPAKLTFEQPPGELEIEQPQADLNITRIPGKLTIDQIQAREDIDLKTVKKRMEEAAQQGKQDILNGIARRIKEGSELMEIEKGFRAISSIAKRNSEGIPLEFGLGFVPKQGSVKINYDPSRVEVEFILNRPRINYLMNKPVYDYQPGKVKIDLKQYQSLEIDFESK